MRRQTTLLNVRLMRLGRPRDRLLSHSVSWLRVCGDLDLELWLSTGLEEGLEVTLIEPKIVYFPPMRSVPWLSVCGDLDFKLWSITGLKEGLEVTLVEIEIVYFPAVRSVPWLRVCGDLDFELWPITGLEEGLEVTLVELEIVYFPAVRSISWLRICGDLDFELWAITGLEDVEVALVELEVVILSAGALARRHIQIEAVVRRHLHAKVATRQLGLGVTSVELILANLASAVVIVTVGTIRWGARLQVVGDAAASSFGESITETMYKATHKPNGRASAGAADSAITAAWKIVAKRILVRVVGKKSRMEQALVVKSKGCV